MTETGAGFLLFVVWLLGTAAGLLPQQIALAFSPSQTRRHVRQRPLRTRLVSRSYPLQLPPIDPYLFPPSACPLQAVNGATDATTTTSTTSKLLKRKRRIWASAMLLAITGITTILVPFKRHSGPLPTFLRTLSKRIQLLTLRQLFFTTISIYAVMQSCHMMRVQRRQAVDATSEWERYAKYPGSRFRAMLHLVFIKVVPRYFLWRLLPNCRFGRTLLERTGPILANGLLKLGPLYIKLGQIISCREDLLPPSWLPAFEKLQDQVPAQTGVKAQALAYSVWPGGQESFDETFTNVTWTPIAAASLGQVHQATIQKTSEQVALKLQRPHLRRIYNQDFTLLSKIAIVVDSFSNAAVGGVDQSWSDIFDDAEEILYREIDYNAEAENGLRIANDFGLAAQGKSSTCKALDKSGKPLSSASPWLRIPWVYKELSSEKVLVMEFVPSVKSTSKEKLNKLNITAGDREYLADCLGRSYLRQFCCHGFFSTDPHAGNVGVEILDLNRTKPEKRVRLVCYDFGQAASLQRNQADGILEIIEAIVDMDVERSVESFQKMRVLKEGADLDAIRAKVADNYRTGKVKANRKRLRKRGYALKEPQTSQDGNATAADAKVMQSFTLPAEYAFVGRALSQMDGVGKSLDPEFDFVSSAAPWIYEIKGVQKYLLEEASKAVRSILPRYNKSPKDAISPISSHLDC